MDKCIDCKIEYPRQTAQDLTKGLCWLCPDEVWICPQCLKVRCRNVPIAGGVHE